MLARAPRRLRPSQASLASAPTQNWPLTAHHLIAIRAYATKPAAVSGEPKHMLAVIGGGLSGLSSAYHFVRALSPQARQTTRIVVLEKENRTGGWCRSVDVPGEKLGEQATRAGKRVVLESGPRSIRPVGRIGWLTVEMAHHVGLTASLLTVAKSAPSAKNRYLFYPDQLRLLPSSLPSAIKAAFTNPVIRKSLPGILLEPFRPRSPLHSLPSPSPGAATKSIAATAGPAAANSAQADESVDSFFRRRFGPALADNMISAMIHGIYSGDTRELSVRAVFPGLWEAEREWGSVVLAGLLGGAWRRWGGSWAQESRSEYRRKVEDDEVEMGLIKERLRAAGQGELVSAMEGASVWGVKGGLEQLTKGVEDWLRKQGVEVWVGKEGTVETLKVQNGKIELRTPTATLHPTHLITSIPHLLPSPITPASIPASTVAVINLAFPRTAGPDLFPPGFGYLIPRSVPASANPHNVLGVIFDSDVMHEVDDSHALGVTKCSILLGGSYWLPSKRGPPSPLPQEHALIQRALETLRLHFPDRAIPEPFHTRARVHKDCIPQVPPGHVAQFRVDSQRIREFVARTGVRVGVAGGGMAVVGVNGAVRAGQEVGESFAGDVNGDVGVVKSGFENWE